MVSLCQQECHIQLSTAEENQKRVWPLGTFMQPSNTLSNFIRRLCIYDTQLGSKILLFCRGINYFAWDFDIFSGYLWEFQDLTLSISFLKKWVLCCTNIDFKAVQVSKKTSWVSRKNLEIVGIFLRNFVTPYTFPINFLSPCTFDTRITYIIVTYSQDMLLSSQGTLRTFCAFNTLWNVDCSKTVKNEEKLKEKILGSPVN